MPEIRRIADQLQRAFDGDPWYGSPLMKILDGVTAQQAAAHPVKDAHSIWQIALHIAAWQGAVLERLAGKAARLPAEGDWPAISDLSEAGWQKTLALLAERHSELMKAISGLTDDQLKQIVGEERDPATGSGVSVYYTLHGIIQHNIYHAGQIAILKKAAS
ncbi:MAG TPA: DinB family protein [Blastocatellia bacterium]|nr:DinB family protein [Blastocatellia bacterium]